MCMPGMMPSMPAPPPPIMAPTAPPPPPVPAPTAASTATATPNISVAKVARKNPLAIQKADSVSTGLNIPV